MKICRDCHVEKNLEDYYRNPGGQDGLQNRCKECSKLAKRESNHRRGIHKKFYKQPVYGPPAPKQPCRKPKDVIPKKVGRPQTWFGAEKDNEVAIYGLYKGEGEFFYVGSTSRPASRLAVHRKTFGGDTYMLVARWCSREQRNIEEMKAIITCHEKGILLKNSGVPCLKFESI